MSVAIIGGNECMVRRYAELCNDYKCKVKVYPKMTSSLKNMGTPDLLVLFTNTVSHKMVHCALGKASTHTKIARSHSSSIEALKRILDEYTV